jgi:hypothetical protein
MATSRQPGKSSLNERSTGELSKAIERPIGQPERAHEEVPIGWDFGPEGLPGNVTGSDNIGAGPLSDASAPRDIGPIGHPMADAAVRGDGSESAPSEPVDERAAPYDTTDDAGLVSGRPEVLEHTFANALASETLNLELGLGNSGGAASGATYVPAQTAGHGQPDQHAGSRNGVEGDASSTGAQTSQQTWVNDGQAAAAARHSGDQNTVDTAGQGAGDQGTGSGDTAGLSGGDQGTGTSTAGDSGQTGQQGGGQGTTDQGAGDQGTGSGSTASGGDGTTGSGSTTSGGGDGHSTGDQGTGSGSTASGGDGQGTTDQGTGDQGTGSGGAASGGNGQGTTGQGAGDQGTSSGSTASGGDDQGTAQGTGDPGSGSR